MSKIDRFLISDGVADRFPDLHVTAFPITIADHRPICMKEDAQDYGPRPFRFFNSWMDEPTIDHVIRLSWNAGGVSMTDGAAIAFKNKLKRLKGDLKQWWMAINIDKGKHKKDLEVRLQQIETSMDSGLASTDELAERLQIRMELRKFEKKQLLDLAQKAKIKWCADGDENTKYYHGILNKKWRQLAIKGIKEDGVWVADAPGVKRIFLDHFRAKFQKF